MLQNNPELKGKIQQLRDNFWSGSIANPLTANEQIAYPLFMRRLTDLEAPYASLSQKAFQGELDLSRVPLPANV